jgi:hypothetical protein
MNVLGGQSLLQIDFWFLKMLKWQTKQNKLNNFWQ